MVAGGYSLGCRVGAERHHHRPAIRTLDHQQTPACRDPATIQLQYKVKMASSPGVEQHPLSLRAIYFVLIGWWLVRALDGRCLCALADNCRDAGRVLDVRQNRRDHNALSHVAANVRNEDRRRMRPPPASVLPRLRSTRYGPSLGILPLLRQEPAKHRRLTRRRRLRNPQRPSILANSGLDRDHLLGNDPGLWIEL